MRRDRILAGALFGGVFLTHALSPIATSFDSRWTIPTALSLVHERNADLNEYVPLLEREGFYAIECVMPGHERRYPVAAAAACPGGRFYNFYPVTVPVLAAAPAGALEFTLKKLAVVLRPLAERMPTAPRRALLRGDLTGSSMIVEVLIASLVIAAAAVVLYRLGREFAPAGQALGAALVFAFATSAWSTGSRGLWMHGFSMLLLPLGLVAILRRRPGVAGAVLALAFFVRPTNAVWFALAAVWLGWESRRRLGAYLAGAAPVTAVFVAINLAMYGTLLAPFFLPRRPGSASLGLHAGLGEALAGHLVSPARGLLVFTPLVLFSLWGLAVWYRSAERRPLACFLGGGIALHYLLISSYSDWCSGHSYGPRYFSDLSPWFALLLVPVFQNIRALPMRALLGVAIGISLFIHARGAFSVACMQWNSTPVDVNQDLGRVWDWTDPPFLRGLHRSAAPK